MTIYRDLARGHSGLPSSLADQARDWVIRDRKRWTPQDICDPSEVLAVYGIIALTSAIQRPAGWSGSAMHGPDDLVDLILRCHLVPRGERGMRVVIDDNKTAMTINHDASKLWTGQVSIEKIWSSCQKVLGKLAAISPGYDDDEDLVVPARLSIDVRAMEDSISATGYDRLGINIAIEDGFAVSNHPNMRLVGARPGIELYSLIGAAFIEECGRWPRPSEPNIPALGEDVPLRDHFDLRAHTLEASSMRVQWRLAGKRGYLIA